MACSPISGFRANSSGQSPHDAIPYLETVARTFSDPDFLLPLSTDKDSFIKCTQLD